MAIGFGVLKIKEVYRAANFRQQFIYIEQV
jgi:hypothetical protein